MMVIHLLLLLCLVAFPLGECYDYQFNKSYEAEAIMAEEANALMVKVPAPAPAPEDVKENFFEPEPEEKNMFSGVMTIPGFVSPDVEDGYYDDWRLKETAIMSLYRGGDVLQKIEATVHLMFECSTDSLYILVLCSQNVFIDQGESRAHSIKLGGEQIDFDPEFLYDAESDEYVGWEAKMTVPAGFSGDALIHTNVYDEFQSHEASINTTLSLPADDECFACSLFKDKQFFGGGVVLGTAEEIYHEFGTFDPIACIHACSIDIKCKQFMFSPNGQCYLNSVAYYQQADGNAGGLVSGHCPGAAGEMTPVIDYDARLLVPTVSSESRSTSATPVPSGKSECFEFSGHAQTLTEDNATYIMTAFSFGACEKHCEIELDCGLWEFSIEEQLCSIYNGQYKLDGAKIDEYEEFMTENFRYAAGVCPAGPPSPSVSLSNSITSSLSARPSRSMERSLSTSNTPTAEPSLTKSASVTAIPSPSASLSRSARPSNTAEPSYTPSVSQTAVASDTGIGGLVPEEQSPSVTPEPSRTKSTSRSARPSYTSEPSRSFAPSSSLSISVTPEPSSTPVDSPSTSVSPTNFPSFSSYPSPQGKSLLTGLSCEGETLNGLFFEDFTGSSDIGGQLFVGGSANLNSFSVAVQLGNKYGSRDGLVVRGGLNFSAGNVNGNIVRGDRAELSSHITNSMGMYNFIKTNPNRFNFEAAHHCYRDLQEDFCSKDTTIITTKEGVIMHLSVAKYGEGLEVLNIDCDALNSVKTLDVRRSRDAATVVLNLRGESCRLGGFSNLYHSEKMLYNFCDASEIFVNGHVKGSILAPNADIKGTQGMVDGQIIARSWNGPAQINNVLLDLPESY